MGKVKPPDDTPAWLRAWTPFLVMGLLIGIMAAGLYGFPYIKSVIHYQDCVASGRTNCDQR